MKLQIEDSGMGLNIEHFLEKISTKKVIIITGPTAVGKTAVAIQLAEHFKTEIISADSRQCYKELKIGVARPSEDELRRVKHHFIASHSITEEVTAAGFTEFALAKTNELFREHDVVIMTGGTGLYLKAFSEGLDEIPAVKDGIREKISEGYKVGGLAWLQDEIKAKDPSYYRSGEILNPHRLMRALEVIESTGQSILSFQKGKKTERDFKIIQIGLELPKDQLHDNINARVDRMMKLGLLDEVRTLLPYKQLNALQTVGYAELFDHLEGKTGLPEAVELIKQHTRQYAKRQLTWFCKNKEIKWFDLGDTKGIKEFLNH